MDIILNAVDRLREQFLIGTINSFSEKGRSLFYFRISKIVAPALTKKKKLFNFLSW